jgi:hypothetical protein
MCILSFIPVGTLVNKRDFLVNYMPLSVDIGQCEKAKLKRFHSELQ